MFRYKNVFYVVYVGLNISNIYFISYIERLLRFFLFDIVRYLK